jgi:hypothetical protein
VLAGVRAGHVFVDTEGTRDRAIDFTAAAGTQKASMGDEMKVLAGEKVHFILTLRNLAGTHPEVVRDGVAELLGDAAKKPTEVREFDQISDGKRHWVRVNVRGADGRLLVLGNPVYLNF